MKDRDWLTKQLERTRREVASWPAGKREAMRIEPPRPDPCHRKAQCREAQTCVGGCVYGNRH